VTDVIGRNAEYELPDVGVYEAAIVVVEDASDIKTQWEKPNGMLKIVYRFAAHEKTRKDGDPFEVTELYGNSLFVATKGSAIQSSKLTKHLQGLFGRTFEDGVNLTELLVGKQVRVNLGHRTSARGGTFPQVLGLRLAKSAAPSAPTATPVPPSAPTPVNTPVVPTPPSEPATNFEAKPEDVPF